ncbi:MAG: NAD(P)H-hydrate dehydratase, partial [Candidatus Thermoplasmatota archaeon]|nr:NAD(P)H-hydrate dehydratase [Candidatus Thermoplasmatota archaeon]
NCGRIEVVKLGYHEKSERYAGPGEFVYYPYPLKDSHKGMNGVTAMVSGWEFRGSSILAALAASKAGTDLVKIYVRGSSPDLISVSYPSLIVRDTDRIGNATEEIGKADCVLVGPGMGKEKEASDFMKHVMSSTRNRIVVDADALAIVAQDPSLLEGRESVLTPHGGEFRKLTGKEPTEENAISAARKLNAVILMKGEVDIITDGTTTIHSEGGNPRLTMGGTGDILAGLVAFFMAKGIQPVRSASMASYLLKRTADYLFRDKAYWYDQMDLLETLAGTMKWIEAFIHSS